MGVVLASGAREVRAVPSALVRSVPENVAAAFFLTGRDNVGTPGDTRAALALAGFLVDRAAETGFLSKVDTTVRAWLDGLAAFSIVLNHAHALAVLDFAATPRADGGHELSSIDLALIIHLADGANDQIERRIQHLLNVFTNDEHSKISRQSHEGGVVFSLRDRRLPGWALIEWGEIGEFYVVALGHGSFRRVANNIENARGSLASSRWFKQAFDAAGGGAASVVAYTRFDRLRAGHDALLATKIARVQSSLGLAGVERGLWTFGYEGRALEANGFVLWRHHEPRPGARRSDSPRDELMPIAGARFLADISGPVIPDTASRYAVVDYNPASAFRRFRDAYLASRSPVAREKSRAFWQTVEVGAGVAFEQDIFSHLARPIVIHDDPRHPLRLPLVSTFLLGIDGDADVLRRGIDTLLTFVQAEYGEDCRWPLRRDADGVWHCHLGFIAPALAVTDRWIVISHSPAAVRRNIELLARPADSE